jgi:hypothetical protein
MTLLLANAGVPLLAAQYLAMVCALVPVILAEIWVARRNLRLNTVQAALAIVPANLVSTLLGFPLIWMLLVLLQIFVGGGPPHGLGGFWSRAYAVVIQAPWVFRFGRDLRWMIPVVSVYLMIPAFFVSVFVERWICSLIWRDLSKPRIRRFSWSAHAVSYAVLLVSVALYYFLRLKFGQR